MNDIIQQSTDGEEQAASLVDIESPHFITTVVLARFFKDRIFDDGKCDPVQDRAITNSIWRMVKEENISLGSAMEWIKAQPKPKPRDQRVLEAWWENCSKIAEEGGNHKLKLRLADLSQSTSHLS